MTLDEKKEHIIRFVGLGMDFLGSSILAECTDEERDVLEKDEAFQRRITFEDKQAELRLLERHDECIKYAIRKGNAQPIQWRLELLNKRYKNDGKEEKEKSPEVHIHLPDNGRELTPTGR